MRTDIPESELKRLYEKEKWPIFRIANNYECSKNSVAYWVRKFKIKRRTQSESMKLFVNKKGINIPKKELTRLYTKNKLDRDEIAKIYGCKIITVTKQLRKYGIKIRCSKGVKVKISKKELECLYKKKKLTTYQIAEIYNCCQATIWKKLRQFNIKARKPYSLFARLPTKKELIDLYVKKGLSTWEIENKYGYPRSTLHRHLRKHSLIKNRAKAHIKYMRKDFNGDLIDKAYLIGFRLGDLRVRKRWENSETIHVDCGSTKIEQINLIRSLFQKYGKIWISKANKKGKIQIEAFLNLSFSFLLEKKVPSWILENKKYFFSFLAGFTDAEGSFGIYDGLATYHLGNYDKELLLIIYKKLKEYGIETRKPYNDHTKGYESKDGYIRKQDYWQLVVGRKYYLLKLIDNLDPFLRHEKKKRDLNIARMNIVKRNKKYSNLMMRPVWRKK